MYISCLFIIFLDQVVGEPRPENPSKPFTDIAKLHNWCRTEYLGNFTGSRGYYFLGELVELEQAIIQLVVQKLRSHNFKLVTVPDILPAEAIENCGMPTKGERAQVKRSINLVEN
jgi:seryl-tRNA synthetase